MSFSHLLAFNFFVKVRNVGLSLQLLGRKSKSDQFQRQDQ